MSQDEQIKKFLSTRKAGPLPHDPSKLRAVQKGESPIGLTVHPPFNAIPFLNVGSYQTLNPKKVRGKSKSEGIKNWINFLGDIGDSSDITDPSHKPTTTAQKLITPVMNQGACGSCWACSTCTAINDNFVYNGLQFNPNISPLMGMACSPTGNFNNKCGGGNPSAFLDWVENNGVATNFCNDYKTNVDASGNVIVPPCGCCNISKTHNKYFIKNKTLAYADIIKRVDGNPTSLAEPDPSAVSKIKDHLLTNGTAVTAFFVFQNWKYGAHSNFSQTNGVYLDTEKYDAPYKEEDSSSGECIGGVIQSLSKYCCIGGHAVCLVGWGIEKSVTRPSTGETLKDVPFWFIRNSWGNQCLTEGFYKIAMSDKKRNININSSCENMQYYGTYIDGTTNKPFDLVQGGVLLFDPADIKPFDKPDQLTNCIPNKIYSEDEPSDSKNFKPAPSDNPTPSPTPTKPTPPDNPTPEKPDPPTPDKHESSDDNNSTIWYILFAIIIAIILFLIL